MAFTVTVTQGGSTAPGMTISVIVLTGAIESGGGNLQAQPLPGAAQGTLTPNGTGSLIYWAIANGTVNTAWTLNSNNSFGGTGLGDFADSTNNYRGTTGAYTGTVTAGTGVTLGASAPTTDDTSIAGYEILSTGSIAVDASTPARNTATTTSITSNSFTPPAGAVLVAIVADNGSGTALQTVSISDTSGLGLTWTRRAISNTSGSTDSLSAIWTTTVPSGGAKMLPQRQPFKHVQTLQRPTPAPVTVISVAPPQAPYLPPRLHPARAVWRGGQGQAYVAVPAPRRLPPVPRRVPSRAVWRGSAPFLGYVAVPAPGQQPRPAPRRVPARAVWRGGQGQAYVFVPAPPQQPGPAPRRKPSRAVVEFTPVTTTNAAAAAISGTVQPWPTVPIPRRRPARSVSRGGQGQAYVAVPAPRQEPRTLPRRQLSRVTWRGGSGVAYVAVPAPRQQPRPAPRRVPGRAYVQFKPVRTANTAAVVTARAAITADYDGKTWWKKKWILRL